MSILIRQMRPEEAANVKKIAKNAFGFLEGMFITKRKDAIVAVDGNKLLGGVYFSMGKRGGKKFGHVDYFFIDPTAQGRGIGKMLCKAAIDHLWELGCDFLLTYVRDDNVASWKLFVENGFVRTDFAKLAKVVGLGGAIHQHCLTSAAFCIGHEIYIAMPSAELAAPLEKPKSQLLQLAIFAVMPILFLLPNINWGNLESLPIVLGALAIIFMGYVLAGFAGTLFSIGRKWRFRFTGGGAPMTFLISLFSGGITPMVGNWYPAKYENTPAFKRDLGIQAAFGWIYLIGIAVVGNLLDGPLWGTVAGITFILLIYRCILMVPFISFDNGRIWNYNKILFFVIAVASLCTALWLLLG